jgi:protein phosphatase
VTGFDNIEHASMTDVGVRRSHNQDHHGVLLARDEKQWRNRGHVFLVADGMGAHAVGELASELAVNIIPHTFGKYVQEGPANALRKAFSEANASIHARGQQNREFEGMGTTATTLLLRSEGAWVGHVGDSRAYRVRDGQIEQLSFDHSLVWEYARRQHLDPEGIQGIPSNVIIRSLGPEPLVQVDVEGPHALQDGDTFVLCSDGLSGQATDHEIGAVTQALPPAEACKFLVHLSNLRGGPDNITVLVVRVGGSSTKSSSVSPIPWYRRLPWPLVTLFLGVICAAWALILIFCQVVTGGLLFFLLAAGILGAGLTGLVLQFRDEKKRAEKETEQPPPRIHRHTPCTIDAPFLDKLMKATQTLKDHVMEKQWAFDGAAYQAHVEQGEKYRGQNDLTGAFREYCRAMYLLLEVLHKQRNKEESFRPLWDKE